MVHYLDNAATTAVRPAAVEVMLPIYTEHYGNPSGAHRMARDANLILDDARATMAEVLGADPGQIVFTGGGTEADALAIRGTLDAMGGIPLCSAIEHHAVLDPVEHLGGRTIAVGADGRLDLAALEAELTESASAPSTQPPISIVSIMLANNETGIVQPLAEAIELIRSQVPEALVHTDAVQALCWLDIATLAAEADLVSVSAHKFGGPKGVGALVVRDRVELAPLLRGGGQERDRRGGTQNVAGIAGMAVAAAETVAERGSAVPRVAAMRDRLADGIVAALDGVVESGIVSAGDGRPNRSHKTANICHLCFEGIESEALLFLLEKQEIMASAASSCASGAMDPSHVLTAMGFSRELAFGSLRLSLGYDTSDADIDAALRAVPAAVTRLRGARLMADVLVAMSGGVDSSVAAAILAEQGHRVVGVTLKLWGGASDSGCCSVSDVDDARRVAQQLGIDHHVFNFGDDFDRYVVDPYVEAHAAGETPNPCVECNRHIKFDKLFRRADALGFDLVATGHHASIVEEHSGVRRIWRGADAAKDQSYVLHMLDQTQLTRLLLPVGDLTKDDVRRRATQLDLTTAAKPDSQDVCFIHSKGGRQSFLGDRIPLRPARLVDTEGTEVGSVASVELVTLGQRRGLDLGGSTERRYVVDVDRPAGTVTVGPRDALLTDSQQLDDLAWSHEPIDGPLAFQCSAHGSVRPGRLDGSTIVWDEPQPKVACGQSIAIYTGDAVVGGCSAA